MKRFWKILLILSLVILALAAGLAAADHYGTIRFDTHPLVSVYGYGWTDIPLAVGDVHCPEGDMMVVRFVPPATPQVNDAVLVFKSGVYGQWSALVVGEEADGSLWVKQSDGAEPSLVTVDGLPAVYVSRIPRLAWFLKNIREPAWIVGAFTVLLALYILYRAWPAHYYPQSQALSGRDSEIETMLDG